MTTLPAPLVPADAVYARRKSISRRLRFEIFKRDGFVCQYCGAKPPSVVLELDHLHHVSKGGSNRRENLITSCFECNRGKSDQLLSDLPSSALDRAELIKEKRDQLRAYDRLVASIKADEERRIDAIEEAFQVHFGANRFSATFRESVRGFLRQLPADVVERAMHKAGAKIVTPSEALRYFCGICYGIIRGGRLT